MIVHVVQRADALARLGRVPHFTAIGGHGRTWLAAADLAAIPAPMAPVAQQALAEYRATMGALAEANGDRLSWWATDLASKNRVASPLPPLLQALAECAAAIAAAGDDGVALVDVPWPVVASLEAAAAQGRFALTVHARPLARLVWTAVSLAVTVRHTLLETARCLRDIWRCRRVYGRPPASARPVHVVKSFVYASSFQPEGGYADPFFGPLPEYLCDRLSATTDVVTLVLGFSDKQACYARLRQIRDRLVVPVEAFERPWDPLLALPLLFTALLRPLRRPAPLPFLGFDLAPLLAVLARAGGGRIPPQQYLHLAAGRRLGRHYAVSGLTLTCEGNPWERMLVAGLRRRSPNVAVTGYQHSVVPQAATGMFLDAREAARLPRPDRLLTVGQAAADLIAENGELSDWARPACALRYAYLFRLTALARRPIGNRTVVLVALEGLIEVVDLVAYVLSQAPACPDAQFVLRCHPVLDLPSILGHLGNPPLPANVVPSQAVSVHDDIAASDAVLYWGTTVAVEALFLGRPVIHFDRGDILSYDPLFQLDVFKWTVRVGAMLGPVVAAIGSMGDDAFEEQKRRAMNYVTRYFHPIDETGLSAFLPTEPAR